MPPEFLALLRASPSRFPHNARPEPTPSPGPDAPPGQRRHGRGNVASPYTLPSSTPQKIFIRAFIRSTAVRPLYIRSNCFVPRGIGGNRRRSRLLLDTHGQPIALPRIALFVAGAIPAFVPRWATILQRASIRFIPDISHRCRTGGCADAVVAVNRAGLIMDHVERPSVAAASTASVRPSTELAVLDHRLEHPPRAAVHGPSVVGRLVVGQACWIRPAGKLRLGLLQQTSGSSRCRPPWCR